jgi:hypothetical protein
MPFILRPDLPFLVGRREHAARAIKNSGAVY